VASHYQVAYRFRYACPTGREFEIAQWFDGVKDASEAGLLRDLTAVAQTLALQARSKVEFTPVQGGRKILETLLARSTQSWAEFVLY